MALKNDIVDTDITATLHPAHHNSLATFANSQALPVNVKGAAFGAIGDGTTDDTAAIQAAINAVGAAGGGVVYFPPGSYKTTSTVTLAQNVSLVGSNPFYGYTAGSSKTTLITCSTSGVTIIDTPTTGVTGCGVYGIDVFGGYTAGIGIRFRNVSWGGVQSSCVSGTTGPAIQQDAGMVCRYADILITGAVWTRTPSVITGAMDISGTDHWFDRIETGTSSTAHYNGNVVAFHVKASTSFFSTCVAEISDTGWVIDGDFNRFVGCRGDTNWGGDWIVNGGTNQFSCCTGMNGAQASNNTYDSFTNNGTSNRFSTCMVAQQGSRTYRYCFTDSVNTAVVVQRAFYDATCFGYGYATACWNTQYYLGSGASTPSAPIRPTGTSWNVTGTSGPVSPDDGSAVTVTTFSGGVTGQDLYIIRGNSNVTIAGSSDIILASGSTLALTGAGSYHFKCWGPWYQVT